LSPQQREQVARRGRRLDETKPGSGLGLSIVVELASLYGGGLTLGTAPIGGLRAGLMLPGGGRGAAPPGALYAAGTEFCPTSDPHISVLHFQWLSFQIG